MEYQRNHADGEASRTEAINRLVELKMMSRFLVEEKDLSIHDSHIYDQRVRYKKEQAKKEA